MKITTTPNPIRLPQRSLPPAQSQQLPGDQVTLQENSPTPPQNPTPEGGSGAKVIGALAGGLVGILAGHAGAAGLATLAGVGAAAVTLAATGPLFQQSLEEAGKANNVFDSVILTCGTIAAAGMLTATMAGAAGGLGYTAGLIAPAAAPVVGGLVGASVGGYFGLN